MAEKSFALKVELQWPFWVVLCLEQPAPLQRVDQIQEFRTTIAGNIRYIWQYISGLSGCVSFLKVLFSLLTLKDSDSMVSQFIA